MSTTDIGRGNIGRIAERIVANELEFRGFLVRDLNLEGFAANVDLLAVKDRKVWQIQVKGCRYLKGWWFQYGYCKDRHIRDNADMFNVAGNSFKADVVVLICVRSPNDYQSIVLPVAKAEEAAQINLNYEYRTKKRDGSDKKANIVCMSFCLPKKSSETRKREMKREQDLLAQYKDRDDKWDIDKNSTPSSNLTVIKD